MPRIAFTVPILPGKQSEIVRALRKYKLDLDGAHKAIGVTQWLKYVRGDDYFELIDWTTKPLATLLNEYMARPEMAEFLKEIVPCLSLPAIPAGSNVGEVFAAFVESRSFDQAYALVGPPS